MGIVMEYGLSVVDKKIKLLSSGMFKMFGCNGSCFHRHTGKCPVKEGAAYPEDMICDERKRWLSSLLPEYSKKPSNAEVMLDIAKALGHMRHFRDYEILEGLEKSKKEIEARLNEEHDEEEIKLLSKALGIVEHNIQSAFSRWYAVWKQSQNVETEKLKMETPKKIEVSRSIRPTDIADMLDKAKKNAIDAEFRVGDETDGR